MTEVTIKAKPYAGMAQTFFSLLHDVCRGHREMVTVEELLWSFPTLQFEREEHREDLEDREPIIRVQGEGKLINESGLFATSVGFIQSNFPPHGSDQLIKARIPATLMARYSGVGTRTFGLYFGEDGYERVLVSFENNPNLPDQLLESVVFNSKQCVIKFQSLTITIDYTQEPLHSQPLIKMENSRFVTLATKVDLQTGRSFSAIVGYFKIWKAFVVQGNCDPENEFCHSEMCEIEPLCEPGEITVAEGETEREAIDAAVEAKREEVMGTLPQPREVAVVWANDCATGKKIVRPYDGNCLGFVVGGGVGTTCYIVTATFGQSEVLRGYYGFRETVLSRQPIGRAAIRVYERLGPHLAAFCYRSRVFRRVSQAIVYAAFRLVVMPALKRR